ncbi:PREDICTED: atypical chemokine receptor 1 [Pygoscelis adeliae]|uniref:atypical chemokine receptor 1 n=1 Tax=Pygoscelis adeliae TaxID=9238 RepID=UPI0004F4E099|nr:PREDICTED: atypical chemokine receptor 1 [Pygoscelis adeliae]
MGNCILVSPRILESENSLDLLDIMGNLSYDDSNMTSLDYDAAPCHNQYCPLFQHVAPTFLAVTCAAATLGTGALLVALAKRPHAWGWPQSRALVAQLAVGMGLFAALLPPVAVGLRQAPLLHLALCLCLFLLLPVVLLVATLAMPQLRVGWEAGVGASWLFFGLWVPYGVGLAVDFLLHAQLLQPTCGTFEHFDYVLGLSEGLGVLHCCLGPAALLAARLCRCRAGASSSC